MADINSKFDIGVTTGPIRGSRKVQIGAKSGSGVRVAMREIDLEGGEPSVRVYDTSGPYTDPDATIDIRAGLEQKRREWIMARGDVEEYTAREVKPEDRPTTDPLKPPSTADSSATGEGGEENDGGDDVGVLFEDGMVVEPGVETRNNEDHMEDDGAFAAEAVEAEDKFTHFKFIYDFTPAQLDDPLLLISPR